MSEVASPAIASPPSLPAFDGRQTPSWGPAAVNVDFADANTPGAIPPDMDAWGKFGHAFGAAYKSTTFDGLSNSASLSLSQAVQDRNKAVKAATGADLEDPTSDGYLDEAVRRWKDETGGYAPSPDMPGMTPYDLGLSATDAAEVKQLQMSVYREKLDQLARDFPGAGLGGDLRTAAQTLANKAVGEAQQAASEAGPVGGTIAGLAGGLAAAWRDPLQMASLFLGGGEANAARSVAGQFFETFARHAAVNAAVTAATEPEIAAWRNERGQPMAPSDALYDIGLAALFGGGVGAVGHLIGRAGQGDAAAARQLADRLRSDKAPEAAAEIAPALRAIEDDHAAAEGAPEGLPPEDARAMLRETARTLERDDAPASGQTPIEAAQARAEALPEASSRLLGESEPPPDRGLDTVREVEPPPAAKAPSQQASEGNQAAGLEEPASAGNRTPPGNQPEPDLFPPHELRAAEAPADDALNKTLVERDGKLVALAADEVAKPNERAGFMAQLIENCVL